MLQYLIILLDDTSPSYCHYEVKYQEHHLIELNVLKSGIMFAMKENLNVQFVYPNYELPDEYLEVIDSIDHSNIKPLEHNKGADVVVLHGWEDEVPEGAICVIHCTFEELATHKTTVNDWLKRAKRLNIVLTDIDKFKDCDIDSYRKTLSELCDGIVDSFYIGRDVQLNLLTDRIMLGDMNNCGAGDTNITLSPNGKFYVCPAFYYEDESDCIGDLENGLNIQNKQLYKIEYAPICRHCDAYQCKRCIWLNRKTTLEVNTPSHQQCVVAHLERNASCELMMKLEKRGIRLENSQSIKEITELDPFNNVNKWK